MNTLNPRERQRLEDLLADEQLDQLSLEDREELEVLRARSSSESDVMVVGEFLVRAVGAGEKLPGSVRARLLAQGQSVVGGVGSLRLARERRPVWRMVGIAAALLCAAGAVFAALRAEALRRDALAALGAEARRAESVRAENAALIAAAEGRAAELASVAGERDQLRRELALAAEREVETARVLASVTERAQSAELKVARYETPADPADLQEMRRTLLSAAGTIRIEWKPFDLPDAPAEQRLVKGDVVWNDEKKEGFLRFVGLRVNDPKVEQYQVWVIDDRGMEQKVSGGVFNATAQGEVIVPINPAIDVRRVSLFAVTIEAPGGTWVPDLRRRLVVAPRGT